MNGDAVNGHAEAEPAPVRAARLLQRRFQVLTVPQKCIAGALDNV